LRIHKLFHPIASRLPVLAALCGALVTGACSNSNSSTTAPTSTTPSLSLEIFSGTLSPGASSFYSYTVVTQGTVNVTLSSLMAGTIGPAAATAVGVGIGVPAGTDCNLTSSAMLMPALTAQLTNTQPPGTYCVSVFDPGTLKTPLNFAIQIVHP
jgi:hypothetical protein